MKKGSNERGRPAGRWGSGRRCPCGRFCFLGGQKREQGGAGDLERGQDVQLSVRPGKGADQEHEGPFGVGGHELQ